MDKIRIFEVFTSLEGEGILYGTKTVFVRFSGCPFRCFYCDTKEALDPTSGVEYSISDACKLIEKHLDKNTYKVNFTGGEPLMQAEALVHLARYVQSKHIPTYLESSCFDVAKFEYVLPYIDYAKIEFKTAESEFVDLPHYLKLLENELGCLEAAIKAKKAVFIKIVVSSKTQVEHFEELVQKIFKIAQPSDLKGFIIQPTYGISEPNLKELLNFYDVASKFYPQVRVVPQLHKMMGAP